MSLGNPLIEHRKRQHRPRVATNDDGAERQGLQVTAPLLCRFGVDRVC
jgi:hypothetical protein